MKRLLMMVPIAALALTGFVPAQAELENTPIVASCVGEAGYEQTQNGPQWKARSHTENVAFFIVDACGVWSPDTAEPLGPPPPPPPLPEPDPGNPDPLGDHVFWLDEWAGPSNPADAGPGTRLELTGAGDFACGEGELQHQQGGSSQLWYQNGGVAHGATWIWHLDWTATVSNGVGEISGTATGRPWAEPNNLETRTLSGAILVDDGATVDQCDDSAGAARFAVTLVLE